MKPRKVPEVGETGYKRRKRDAYYTEPWLTQLLLDQVRLRGEVWEPACGRGDLAKVVKAQGYTVWSSDLYNETYGDAVLDFLEVMTMHNAQTIITNAPFSLAREFIDRALALTKPVDGMVVMLFPHVFDTTKGRVHLFDRPPFFKKVVSLKRPRWDWWEVVKSPSSPRVPYSWYVWDWTWKQPHQTVYGPVTAPLFEGLK